MGKNLAAKRCYTVLHILAAVLATYLDGLVCHLLSRRIGERTVEPRFPKEKGLRRTTQQYRR